LAKEDQGDGFGLGFVLGLVIGGALGVIFAPQSGEQTRRQIANRASEIKESAEDLIEQARKNLEEAAQKVEGLFGAKEKNVQRKIEELRAELEKYNLEKA